MFKRKTLLALVTTSFFASIAITPFFELVGLDMYIQQHFYHNGEWLIDNENQFIRLFLYKAPKKILIFFGVSLLSLYIGSFFTSRFKSFRTSKNLYIILCLALIPSIVGFGKKTTNVFCPYQLTEFGGTYKYSHLYEQSPVTNKRGKCFPAGHASGGFALVLFLFIAETKKKLLFALVNSMLIGWAMAGYQMLNGRHFLSHSLTSLLISLFISSLLYLLIFQHDEGNTRKALD